MFEELWSEIADAPGEIFDTPMTAEERAELEKLRRRKSEISKKLDNNQKFPMVKTKQNSSRHFSCGNQCIFFKKKNK